MGVRHRRRLPARTGGVLARHLRLARPGGPAQRVRAAQGHAGRHRPALPSRPRCRAGSSAAPADARLAGLGVRVPGDHPAARRSGAVRRRPRRCVHGGRSLAAGLRPVLRTRAAALLGAGDGRLPGRADDRRAWLPALRGTGRRLGLVRGVPARLRPCGEHGRHPPQPAAAAPRPGHGGRSDPGGAPLPRRARDVPERGNRLPVDPGHAAADPGVRADRFARGPRRLDRREVPRLVRLRRRRRDRVQQGPDPGQHRALLVHRRHRLVVLAVLRAPARAVADSGRSHGRRADGLRRVPARDPAPAALAGGTDVHRYPTLERDAARRPFRSYGAAGRAGGGGAGVLPAAAERFGRGPPMIDTPACPVREAWAAGRAARNAWLTIPDAHLAETVAARGMAEAVTVDLQHGLFDHGSAVSALRAIAAHGCAPLVRLPAVDAAVIGYMLDAGAAGVIAPMVESAAEAEALAAPCRYPPHGRRSHGPTRAALRPGSDAFAAAEQAIVLAMVETSEGLARCEDLAGVPGLDGLFVGPGDLGLSLGLGPGQDREEPELVAAFQRVLAACRGAGKRTGIHAGTASYAARMAVQGFDLVTVWVDAVAIASTLAAAATTWTQQAGSLPKPD